jgi:hypothetical protein
MIWVVIGVGLLVLTVLYAIVAKQDREYDSNAKYADAQRRKRAMREANR